jgi:transcription elongation factor Elf1
MNDARLTTQEQLFNCPYCGEEISMVLDLSAGSQRYVEDCEVCCNPIDIDFQLEEGTIVSFRADIP